MMKKGDLVLLGAVLILVLAGFLFFKWFYAGGADLVAVIKQDGKTIRTIDLNQVTKNEEIRIKGKYEDVIQVEKGRIRFREANCPDKVCVRSGWLSGSGQMAACLPNRTIIELKGKKSQVDGVAY